MLNVFANNIENILSLFNCRHVNHMPTKGKCSFSFFLLLLKGSQKFSSPLNSIMTGSICSLYNAYLPRVYHLFASKPPSCTLLTLTPQSFMISTRKSQYTYPSSRHMHTYNQCKRNLSLAVHAPWHSKQQSAVLA